MQCEEYYLKIPLGAQLNYPDGSSYGRVKVGADFSKGVFVHINLQNMVAVPYDAQTLFPSAKSISNGKAKQEVWVMLVAPANRVVAEGKSKVIRG